MVTFLTRLSKDSPLHICFASRHYPHISVATDLSVVLEERDGHQEDIATYLSSALQIGHSRLAEEIRSELKEKACGVFMWVVLVVDILNKEYVTNITFRQKRLQNLVNCLFYIIFIYLEKREKKKLFELFYIVFI